jgi:hypothetical protein
MQIINRANLSPPRFAAIEQELSSHQSLQKVLDWSNRQSLGDVLPEVIADVVIQDEYTHDVVVLWRDGLVIVYDST